MVCKVEYAPQSAGLADCDLISRVDHHDFLWPFGVVEETTSSLLYR